MNYQSAIQYLYDRLPVFHHVGSAAYKPGLDNTIKLMNAMNNPQKKFRAIHVAGTNGKGSVSHLLAAVLQSAGYKTGLYTSPHLVDFGERIKINGKMINPGYVVDFIEKNNELFAKVQPSFFEATMAMAFCYFADEKVDIAVIETGLGGRLDSTNIIEPMLSVITNISYDHVAFLGNSLEKIAFEKAGIIKPNTPVVIGEWQSETFSVFERKAKEEGSDLFLSNEVFSKVCYQQEKMLVENRNKERYLIGLNGDYQLKNLSTVLCAIQVFNKLIAQIEINNANLRVLSLENIRFGIENVVELTGLQGRWQIIQQQPLIVTDTGHNEGGFSYIVQQLQVQKFEKLHIIIGMVNDKDLSAVLKLLPKKAQYYFTQANIIRALPANDLHKQGENYGLTGDSYKSVKDAINSALTVANPDDFIFIGGSNFVVGEALQYFRKQI